ncbi:MAG TPA: methyltransferase [Terriglobales bacterium]|nr:methyltransferase [Terriglobales bacterium]
MSQAAYPAPPVADALGLPAPDPVQHIMQLATGYIVSSVLNVAVKLNIADQLAAGPKTAPELAALTGSNAGALYRALRLLAMVGVFHEDYSHRFGLTPVGETLLSNAPGSMRASVEWLSDPFHFRVHEHTAHAIRTGETVDRLVTGKPIFEYLAEDQEEGAVFHRAMSCFTANMTPALLSACDFSAVDTLVDVGGGHGAFLTSALQRFPHLKGVLYDVPQVAEAAAANLERAGVAGRCSVKAGNFFESVPAGADAYMMKLIIHDWADAPALTILSNCRKALEGVNGGRLLIFDAVIAPGNEPHFAKLIDIEMLLLPGGIERTAKEFKDLLSRAGFRLTQITPTKCPLSVIEAVCA